jgi:hypothetical protein
MVGFAMKTLKGKHNCYAPGTGNVCSGGANRLLGTVLPAVLFLFVSAEAAVVITPSGQTFTEGGTGNFFPFSLGQDTSEVPSGTQRYQQVYNASEFSGLVPGGEFITQLAFRPDIDGNFAGPFTATLPSIRIDLSTVAAGADGLSSTFANNVGANDTIVYGGVTGAALSISSSFTGPVNGPKNFDIIINLTTPFFYNPAAGNLLLDVRNFGGGSTALFDAQATPSDSVSRVATMGSGVGSPTADLNDTLGLVTKFTTAVPEPGALGLIGAGLLGLRFWRPQR